MTRPLLYSFRRCPYAIRARLALFYAEQPYNLHEVVLKEKPPHLLEISPKGTVPVMQFLDGKILEESLDIALWALGESDPHSFLPSGEELSTSLSLIAENDKQFKHWLDLYKYADRHPQNTQSYYREQGEVFLGQLEAMLTTNKNLLSEQPCLVDIAILPFVRQFAFVDKHWFDASPYTHLQHWLQQWLSSASFLEVMKKAK